jgi:pimeloyl-ACP methyl ester carboxylesterase
LWVTLMREALGYSKSAAEGGDWGAFVTQQLGHKYPQHLIGIYLTLSIPMDFFSGGAQKESDYGADEQAALARTIELARAGRSLKELAREFEPSVESIGSGSGRRNSRWGSAATD